jgi:hypothetical protein
MYWNHYTKLILDTIKSKLYLRIHGYHILNKLATPPKGTGWCQEKITEFLGESSNGIKRLQLSTFDFGPSCTSCKANLLYKTWIVLQGENNEMISLRFRESISCVKHSYAVYRSGVHADTFIYNIRSRIIAVIIRYSHMR